MIEESKDLDEARRAFLPLSNSLIDVARTFQIEAGDATVEAHCPMAFNNQGANWLQTGKEIHNPYFGAKMLNCGEIVGTFGIPVTQYDVDPVFRESLGTLLHHYFEMQNALASDDFGEAKKESAALEENLKKIDMTALTGDAHDAWMKQLTALTSANKSLSAAKNIKDLRVAFEPLSESLEESVESFRPIGHEAIYRVHCPMAFDYKGADWLQKNEEIRNPYFGAEMLNCGSIKAELLSNPETTPHEHGK